MLKPSYFYGKSDTVLKYYQDLEDFLLEDIAKFLIKSGRIGGKADRELFILEQMGMKDARITKRLAELSGKSRNAVRKVLQDSVMTSFSNDKEVLSKYFSGEFGPLNNPAIVDVMDAEWIKTCGELSNLTMTTMGQYNTDVINLLNQAEIRVASGTQSYSSAVCDVLDEYAKSGMVINYPTGARMTLESAVRCAVVTSMNQTAAQVTNKYIAEGGIEYVLVSAHTGARYSDKGGLYSHDEWQGKVYKIRGSEDGFPNLLEATGYDIDPITGNGTVVNPHGLHGYNCRHSHQPWDKDLPNPWIKPDGTPRVDPEESREKYDLQQKQRAMERGIRSSKRQLNMKQTEIDTLPDGPEKEQAKLDYDKLAYRLRQRNKAYNEFCSENKLTKQADRVKVAGFTKADAQKANGRATIYGNELEKVDSISNGVQHYKKIDLSDKTLDTVSTYAEISYRKINTYENLYVSNKVNAKPKMIHDIDVKIREAMSVMKISTNDNIPTMIVVSDTEISKASYAAYRAADNKLFINEKIISALKEDNRDALGTVCHEFFHWKDAQEHIKNGGIINDDYFAGLQVRSKREVDKLESRGYNVKEVSPYAKSSLSKEKINYDEAYTEYRVKKLLEGYKK